MCISFYDFKLTFLNCVCYCFPGAANFLYFGELFSICSFLYIVYKINNFFGLIDRNCCRTEFSSYTWRPSLKRMYELLCIHLWLSGAAWIWNHIHKYSENSSYFFRIERIAYRNQYYFHYEQSSFSTIALDEWVMQSFDISKMCHVALWSRRKHITKLLIFVQTWVVLSYY